MSIRSTQLLLSVLLLFAVFPPAAYSQPIIWEQASNGMGDSAFVFAMAWNAQGLPIASIGHVGKYDGLFSSTNGGEAWFNVMHGSNVPCINDLAIDTSGWIYAATGSGLYLSTDNGMTWVKKIIHDPLAAFRKVFINHNGFIFTADISMGENLYRSTDRGETWEVSLDTPRPVMCIASNSQGTLFVGIRKEMGYGGLAISTDNGYTWRPRLFTNRNVFSIVTDHDDRVLVFTDETVPHAVFRSTDEGHTWDSLSMPPELFSTGVNSANQLFGAVYRITGYGPPSDSAGIILSTDHGDTWFDASQGLPAETGINAIYVSPDDYVFLGTDRHGFYRSSQPTTSVQTSRPGDDSYLLGRNYPNPVTGSTTIPYTLPREEKVSLTVLNTLGQVVATLVDEHRGPGAYEARWQTAVPAGLYFYRLRAGAIVETRKMIVR